MSKVLLFSRACLAIILTGISASILVGIASMIWNAPLEVQWDFGDSIDFMLTFTLFGSVIGSFFALGLGVLVEVPKIIVMMRKRGQTSLAWQFAISTIGGVVLLALANWILGFLEEPNHFVIFASGLALGACSGLFWWALVARSALPSNVQ